MKFPKLKKREEGQGLVEYALILVLVAAVVIGILFLLGPRITVAYARIIGAMNGMGGYEFAIGSASVSTQDLGGACKVTASASVSVSQNGAPASSSVKVIGVVTGPASMTISGDVTGSGNISGSKTVSGSCPSGGATFVVGDAVKTVQ